MRFVQTLCLLLISLSASAIEIEKVYIQNLNLNYAAPKGAGTADKIHIGISNKSISQTLEVERVDSTLVLRTEYLSLTWSTPFDFLLTLQNFDFKNLHLSFDKQNHFLRSDEVSFKMGDGKDYLLQKIELNCDGASRMEDLDDRLMDDCREKMLLRVGRVEVPMDFFLNDILKEVETLSLDEIPVSNLYVTSENGAFYSYFYTRYYVWAGLRAYGSFEYSPDHKKIIIKINQIKFGILPVTSLVMNEIKKRIKHPNIVVDPPYITITK